MRRAGVMLMIAVVIGGISKFVFAGNTNQANSDGKAFADSINNSKIKDLGKIVDPNSIPNYQGADVPEKKYYNSGLNIENEAQEFSNSDDNARYINSAKNSRPLFNINSEEDPLFKRYEEISEKSTGLLDSYSGCVELPVGQEDVSVVTNPECSVKGVYYYEYPTCKRNFSARCNVNNLPPIIKNMNAEIRGLAKEKLKEGTSPNLTVNFTTGNYYSNVVANYHYNIAKFNYKDVCENKNALIEYHGIEYHFNQGLVFINIIENPNCSNGLIGKYRIINHSFANPRVFHLTLKYKLVYKKIECSPVFNESLSCDISGSYSDNQLISKKCVDSGVKIINGFEVYKACWSWEEKYKIEKIKYEEDEYCQELVAKGCGLLTSKCKLQSSQGHCLDNILTFSCNENKASKNVILCGSSLVCPDGQCTSEFGQEYDPSTDAFKKAATALAVADEISKQLDVDNLTVFKGVAKSCDKKAAGFSNCCKDSGWGADIGLASCSNEEKELGLMKEAKRVHFVGDYCAEKVLGACIRKKYVYCTYPSKLSRILMEQGNAQLGRGYGGAKNPDCKGFTIKELENLNFDGMDLSEFYSDVMSNAVNGSTPNATGAAQSIQEKLNARYPQLSEGDK